MWQVWRGWSWQGKFRHGAVRQVLIKQKTITKGGDTLAEHRMLKAEELEVGMEVAYPYSVSTGYYRNFRHRLWKGYTILRITPKRTNVVLIDSGGQERDVDLRRYNVFALDDSMQTSNEMVEMYRNCRDVLGSYRGNEWKRLEDLPDDDLKEANTLLTKLDRIMRKEKGRLND